MWRHVVKAVLSLPILIAAGVFGLYLVFGFFLVDPLAKKLLPWVGENKLASRLSAQKVSFNPLTLEATVEGLRLADKSGAPLAGFERLYINLETTGLMRWAWRIQSIQLERPQATLVVQPGGKLNWAALLAKLQEDKEPPSDTIPRMLIEQIKITNGNIEYTDANRRGKPFKAVLQPLGIELDGLSTLPEDRGDYLIAAKFPEQGGTLKWKGDVGLNPVASSGELGLEGVRLAKLLRVIKGQRNFDVPSGTLAASLRYRFAMVQDKVGEDIPWLQINGANLIVQDLALTSRGNGAPLLQLAEARVSDANIDMAKRHIDVAGVSLVGGKFTAMRDVKGTLDWQALFAHDADAGAPTAASPENPATDLPWKVGVREIKLADWSARFIDQGYAMPLGVSAENFTLSAALMGEVGTMAAIDIGPVNAALGPIKVQSGSQTVAELQRATLVNAGLKLADKRLTIEAVVLNGAKTTLALDKHKTLNWTDILQQASGVPAAGPEKTGATGDSPLDVRLARFSLDGIDVGIIDKSSRKSARLDLVKGFIALKDISLDMNKAVPLEVGFALRQGGRFNANGTVIPGKTSGNLNIKLVGLSLKPLAPYVNEFARLNLHSGAATTRGKLTFSQVKSGMKLGYRGGFVVDDLAITEEETEEAFLGWSRLSSNHVRFDLNPNRLRMSELVAKHPFGKIIIFEDKTINLQRVLRTPASGKSTAKAAGKKQQVAQSAYFPLDIERLRIVGANMEFADLSLPQQFGTRMHDLSGVVTGLATNPAKIALVELDGKVDDYGSVRVRGSVRPFQATDFTDLKLTFRNLEMTNLTPYSGKFAGRKIDSGKLSVDLEYKIKQRQLAGENKFVINTLKLGERVDSPDAMKLPLDLAIALLEDSNGIIDLDLPISGSLDDPQFSYGKIIWKAIVNVLTKLVTAPFRALGKLLGISSEKIDAVTFDPGSSKLLPPEQEKLKVLSEAMAKRPALTLTLEPGYDPESDRRALQVQDMRREVAAGVGLEPVPNEEPGPVDVNNYKVQTWLEDRYAERAGKEAYKTLRASYKAKQEGGTNPITDSILIERLSRNFKTHDSGPVSAFHTELLEQLTQKTAIDDSTLVKLAQARGQVMREDLLKNGLDDGRVSVADPVRQAARDKQVGSKMILGAARRAPSPASSPVTAVP